MKTVEMKIRRIWDDKKFKSEKKNVQLCLGATCLKKHLFKSLKLQDNANKHDLLY